MKKVIGGRLYDTAKAEELGRWETVEDGLFGIEETLYRTKRGKYFLHGIGGANTKYGSQYSGGGCGGEEIIPLSEAEAREWCEENLSGEKYIEIWGEPEEA